MPETAPLDLEALLRRLLKEIDDDKAESRLRELETKGTVSVRSIIDALKEAPEEEREELSGILSEALGITDAAADAALGVTDPPDPPPTDPPTDPPADPAKRTRQGRKRDGVYDFDEKGEKTDHLYVYSGEDEPDEVELEDEEEPDA